MYVVWQLLGTAVPSLTMVSIKIRNTHTHAHTSVRPPPPTLSLLHAYVILPSVFPHFLAAWSSVKVSDMEPSALSSSLSVFPSSLIYSLASM